MIPDLEPAGYVIQEVQAKPGFLLDDTPKTIEVKDHRTYTVEFFNQPKGGILILKKDSQTGEPLAGVEFKVTTANGEFVANNGGLTSTNGIYTTNEDGQIEITQLKPGTYTVAETKTLEDYVLDAAPQTVVVEANDLQMIAPSHIAESRLRYCFQIDKNCCFHLCHHSLRGRIPLFC